VTGDDRDEVLAAATHLVDALGRHDTAAYFACFVADASFVLHSTPGPLPTRGAYERLWDSWERESDFRVHACASTEQGVRLLGDAAVFTHRRRTDLELYGVRETRDERETIVFERQPDDRWAAVHEHLSPSRGRAPRGPDDPDRRQIAGQGTYWT
jgi:ketosteroid isomerase-like protein